MPRIPRDHIGYHLPHHPHQTGEIHIRHGVGLVRVPVACAEGPIHTGQKHHTIDRTHGLCSGHHAVIVRHVNHLRRAAPRPSLAPISQ